jgi:hypothetical protein
VLLLVSFSVAVEESARRLAALEGVDATAARLTAESQRLREKLEQAEGQVGGLGASTCAGPSAPTACIHSDEASSIGSVSPPPGIIVGKGALKQGPVMPAQG